VGVSHYYVGGFAADDVQDCVGASSTLIGGDRNAAMPADMRKADNVMHEYRLLDVFKRGGTIFERMRIARFVGIDRLGSGWG